MNELVKRKEKLLSVERSLKSFIETDTSILEAELRKYLKTGVIVGSSLLAAYTVYKILENKETEEGDEESASPPIHSRPFISLKSRIGAIIFTFLYNEFTKWLKEGKKEVEESLSDESKTD